MNDHLTARSRELTHNNHIPHIYQLKEIDKSQRPDRHALVVDDMLIIT